MEFKLEELDPEVFTYDSHVMDYGDYLDLSYSCFSPIPEIKDKELHVALRKYAVGWCKGDRLPYKPRTDLVGIMCEKDGERFWFHLMQETLDYLLGTWDPQHLKRETK